MVRLPLLMGTGEQSAADRVTEAAQLSRFMRTLSWFVTFVAWVAVFGTLGALLGMAAGSGAAGFGVGVVAACIYAGADVVRWFRRPRLP